jgi:hypothetical protein
MDLPVHAELARQRHVELVRAADEYRSAAALGRRRLDRLAAMRTAVATLRTRRAPRQAEPCRP